MLPYAISSDQHAHSWTQFARVTPNGVNSRLQSILDELVRKAEYCVKHGIARMFLGGDLFHVRGHLEPEVLNPVNDTFKKICAMGVQVIAIAGNHDLQGELSSELGNAMQSLSSIEGFTAVTKPQVFEGVIVIPWVKDLTKLREMLVKLSKSKTVSQTDVIIHAPVNGVLKGIPDHGLEADELKKLGFRNVWAGHYHNAVDFGGGVRSIGATTHQTWSDPDTKAGFWVVDDERVEFHPTHAPLFVNYDAKSLSKCKGNYVRIKLNEATPEQIDAAREAAKEAGALGVVDHSSKKRAVTRTTAGSAAGATLEASVSTFITDTLQTPLDRKRITLESLALLSQARSKGSE